MKTQNHGETDFTSGSRKKSNFFSCPTTKPLPPHFLSRFFFRAPKQVIFLVVRPSPSPLRPLKKITKIAASLLLFSPLSFARKFFYKEYQQHLFGIIYFRLKEKIPFYMILVFTSIYALYKFMIKVKYKISFLK